MSDGFSMEGLSALTLRSLRWIAAAAVSAAVVVVAGMWVVTQQQTSQTNARITDLSAAVNTRIDDRTGELQRLVDDRSANLRDHIDQRIEALAEQNSRLAEQVTALSDTLAAFNARYQADAVETARFRTDVLAGLATLKGQPKPGAWPVPPMASPSIIEVSAAAEAGQGQGRMVGFKVSVMGIRPNKPGTTDFLADEAVATEVARYLDGLDVAEIDGTVRPGRTARFNRTGDFVFCLYADTDQPRCYRYENGDLAAAVAEPPVSPAAETDRLRTLLWYAATRARTGRVPDYLERSVIEPRPIEAGCAQPSTGIGRAGISVAFGCE
ncbi:MAG: hypothetical protein AAFR17_02715 [Pseudomonadota bacterium]